MNEQFPTLTDIAGLAIRLSPIQIGQFETYARELIDWNKRINLTSITEQSLIYKLHFLDSLTSCMAIPNLAKMHVSVCDVGSGAGFPGLPLKIAFPTIRLTLVDSISKRTDFLKQIVNILGLDEVTVVTDRSESILKSSLYSGISHQLSNLIPGELMKSSNVSFKSNLYTFKSIVTNEAGGSLNIPLYMLKGQGI